MGSCGNSEDDRVSRRNLLERYLDVLFKNLEPLTAGYDPRDASEPDVDHPGDAWSDNTTIETV